MDSDRVRGSTIGSLILAVLCGVLISVGPGDLGALSALLIAGLGVAALAISPLPARYAGHLGWNRVVRWRWLMVAVSLIFITVLLFVVLLIEESLADSKKEEDLSTARFMARIGTAVGVPPAMHNLAVLYEGGKGGEASQERAIMLYRRAAERGFADSQERLGNIYYTGKGLPKDEVTGVKWFRRAADQGNAQALHNLAVAYHYGHGVALDPARAMQFYTRSAEAGYALANGGLGILYRDGLGVPADAKRARQLFRLAADAGDGGAQFNLGAMLYNAEGGPADRTEAMALFRQASKSDDPEVARLARETLDSNTL